MPTPSAAGLMPLTSGAWTASLEKKLRRPGGPDPCRAATGRTGSPHAPPGSGIPFCQLDGQAGPPPRRGTLWQDPLHPYPVPGPPSSGPCPAPAPARAREGNPEKQQAFFDDLRARIQRAGPNDHFLFIDACTLQRCATITRMWGQRGQQPVVKMDGRGEKVNVYGALDVTGDFGNFFFTPKINATHYCSYLRQLAVKYPAGTLHIILDNAPAHHAKMTQACATALAPYMDLIFLPPYSPQLNPIEKFWKMLRKRMTHNACFPSFFGLKIDVAKLLCQFTVPNEVLGFLYNIYFIQGPFPVSAL